jgi:hypothetical protein
MELPHVLTFACLFLSAFRGALVASLLPFLLKRFFTERTMGRFIVLKHEKDKDKENKDNKQGKDRNGNDDIGE